MGRNVESAEAASLARSAVRAAFDDPLNRDASRDRLLASIEFYIGNAFGVEPVIMPGGKVSYAFDGIEHERSME
jgi:hypothetical protein